MPERVGIETGMQTETFIIFSSNEPAFVGKIAQLKVCILNSINSLNVTLKNVLKEKVLPSMALSENHLVHTVDNDLSPKFFTFCPRSSQRIERTSMRNLKTNLHVNSSTGRQNVLPLFAKLARKLGANCRRCLIAKRYT